MRTPSLPARAVLAAAFWLAGCATPTDVHWHSLLSPQPLARPAPRMTVRLGTITVPPGVDQPQWLVRLPDDSLRMLEQERWTAPLRDELRAALREGLEPVAGTGDDPAAPSQAAPSRPPAWRLDVDVVRFESRPAREAWIEARWSLTPSDSTARTLNCTTTAHESATGDAASLASGHRRAVARLIDDVSAALGELAADPAGARCPRHAGTAS